MSDTTTVSWDYVRKYENMREQLSEAAAFLDQHADLIMKWPVVEHWKEYAAADCRALAKRLRGET
jgi:hypothetical protein